MNSSNACIPTGSVCGVSARKDHFPLGLHWRRTSMSTPMDCVPHFAFGTIVQSASPQTTSISAQNTIYTPTFTVRYLSVMCVPSRKQRSYECTFTLSEQTCRWSDLTGDGLSWQQHCRQHYTDLFLLYETRAQHDSLPSIGVVSTSTHVEYRNGEGLGGERPEFHDSTSLGVTSAPAFCPFCVFDPSLEWALRMKQ